MPLLLYMKKTVEKYPHFVIPALAGIQKLPKTLDSRFHGNDDLPNYGSKGLKKTVEKSSWR
jgi:hypothetical protein